MLLSALRSGDKNTILIALLACIFLVFVVVPIHEFAHVWAANKLGDDTGKLLGRYTINPMAHIDPIGAIMICLIGFGWGKPSPINPNRFQNPKKGLALTAAAGPLANLILAFLLIAIGQTTYNVGPFTGTNLGALVYLFCYMAAEISIFLAVFNLVPVPPLDGYNIIESLLPESTYEWINRNRNAVSIVFILLLFSGIITKPLSILADYILHFMLWLTALPLH